MIQLAIIVGYLLLVLGLGFLSFRSFRGTSKDYMLASHTIGPFLLLMSLFGTTMTAFALVGSTAEAYSLGVGVYGMLASASGIVHSGCFFLIGLKLWQFGRRYGYTTQVQFFRDRLDSEHIGLVLFPILVALVIPYLLIGVISSGLLIESVTDSLVPKQAASAGICLVVLTYVFGGGMRGTAWANAFQTLVFLILGLITFVTIAYAIGGENDLLANLRIASEQVPEEKLSRVDIPKPLYFSFLLIPLSVGMFPHVFQHWLTARNASSFKLPIVMHPIFIMILWLPCVLMGVWASSQNVLPGIRPNDVLPQLVATFTGPVLGGLLAAGILAAIMSSLDSQFLCLGTIFTKDIILHYGGERRFTDKQTVLMARGFVIAIVALTYFFSLFPPPNIFRLGIWCFSGFVGLFPLAFAAIYWKRLTLTGAYASILTVIVTWGAMFYQSDYARQRYAFPPKPVDLGIVVIPPMLPVVTIFALSVVVLVAVSLVTKPPRQETIQKFFGDQQRPTTFE